MVKANRSDIAYRIHHLPYVQKVVLALFYKEGFNFGEIAQILDLKRIDGKPDAHKVRRLYIRAVSKVIDFDSVFKFDESLTADKF